MLISRFFVGRLLTTIRWWQLTNLSFDLRLTTIIVLVFDYKSTKFSQNIKKKVQYICTLKKYYVILPR